MIFGHSALGTRALKHKLCPRIWREAPGARHIKVCLAVVLSLLLVCPSPASAGAQRPQLTLMVYLCGSDLESKVGAATEDLEEMRLALPPGGEVQVLVLAGGATAWQHPGISADQTAIFRLGAEGLVEEKNLGKASMGDPNTLAQLLQHGAKQHPADQYALILWDHGAGPMMGLCFDERVPAANGFDSLSLLELQQALDASPFAQSPLSFIGLDACLMASLEVASALVPYAHHLIASQETEPVSGWDYSFIKGLAGQGDGAQSGQLIIDTYFLKEGEALYPLTLSCLNLERVAALEEALDQMFELLAKPLTETRYQQLIHARNNSKMVAGAAAFSFDLVDLKDLLQVLEEDGTLGTAPVLAALSEVITYSRSNTDFLHGLSLYFPFDNPALYLDKGQDVLGTQAGYGYFSQQMAKMWMGKALIDWSVLDQLQVQAREAGVRVKLPLSMPQAQGLTQAKLRVLEKLADDAFAYLHTTQDFYLDPTEGLDLFYPYQALYMVDAEGRRLTSPLSYFQQDEALVLYGMLQKEEFKGPGDIIAAVLEYRKDQQGIYQLAQVRESSQNPALQGKPTLRLGDWHSLLVMRAVMSPARDGEGRMQAIRHWPVHPDYIALQPLALKDASFRPQFLTLENSGELYFMLEIADIQNKVVCTELMPLAPAQ